MGKMLSSSTFLVAVFYFSLQPFSSAGSNYKPIFQTEPTVIAVNESEAIGSQVAQLKAVDTENDPIIYSLDDIGKEILTIGPNDGILRLKVKLDQESKKQYQFKAYAEDLFNGGGAARRVEKTLYLVVIDVNDNAPLFVGTPYVAKVSENATVGYLVLRVRATDSDVGNNGNVQYNFSDNQQTSKFSIDNLNGEIRLTGNLDYEDVQQYTLFVEAKDGGVPQLTVQTTVIINVIDVSDNPPKFAKSLYSEDIEENAIKGAVVAHVSAFDGDVGVGNSLGYSILSGNDNEVFTINNLTGVITVNGDIDAETTSSYSIKVQAVEIPDPQWNATVEVSIRVLDQNDNKPTFPKPEYHYTVKEDTALPGYPITDRFDARDSDEERKNNYFEYELSGKESEFFSVDKKTGRLTINSTLDYEKQVNYTFYINATETLSDEKFSARSLVLVEVVNVNDNSPKFNASLYNYTFDEEVPKGVVIAQVKATDDDLGSFGELTYQLKGSDATLFSVDPNNGSILTTDILDYENAHRYEFFLEAKDGGGIFYERRSSVTIIVNIQDINDNSPVFINLPYITTVDENKLSSNFIFKVLATDKDSTFNGKVSYSLIDGNIGNVFQINQSGVISTNTPLDHENISQYDLTIMAQDNGDPKKNTTTTCQINVNDLNDNKPIIKGGTWITVNISESAGGGTNVYTVEASDKDIGQNGKLTYALISGANGRFILNSETGALQISPTGLDREIDSVYNLTVNVTDRGEPQLWASTVIEVKVLDVNDNSPEFNPSPSLSEQAYVLKIEEGPSTVNKTILDINATDKDYGINAKIVYSLAGDPNAYFSINETSGELIIKKELNREGDDVSLDEQGNVRFTLRVIATDQAYPPSTRRSSSVTVTVIVTDANDNIPSFTKPEYRASVSEATRPGSNVIQVSAIDEDLSFAGAVQYNITAGDPYGVFEVSESSGYIFLKKRVDADLVSEYNLTIEATDRGTPPRSSTAFVIIEVDDVNDNDPVFNETLYKAFVKEDANVSTSVVTVVATDRDKGSNGEVYYAITSGNSEGFFRVDNKTGVVSTAGSLDRERTSKYTLIIQAQDSGHPSARKSFAELLITIEDVNDNYPQFTRSSYEAEVMENSPPSVTVQPKQVVHASDSDEGINAKVFYSLSGLGSSNFMMNASTGIITTGDNSSLDRERNSSFSLQIVATDGGGLSSSVPLTIYLKDANDEYPQFSDSIFHFNVSEAESRGTILGRVTASDDDEGFNKEIVYTSTGADAKFYISRSTGDIIVDSALDREFKSFYILNVTAANIGSNPLEGHCQVYITVTDVVDDKPFFQDYTISVHVLENVSIGTNITQVSALDKDVGDTLSYSIVGGDLYGQFDIGNTTGILTLLLRLDRENSSQHELSIQASDSINLKSDLLKLVVEVDDVNDNAPEFSQSHFVEDYWEQSPAGTSIITVKAHDSDHGINAKVVYSIVENIPGTNVSEFVQINPQTGLVLQGVKEFDREASTVFNFTVHAKDSGTPALSSNALVSINLVDINDNNPKFTQAEYRASVKENSQVGTEVLVVKANDKDSGINAQLAYGMTGDDFKFQIDGNTGNVTTAKVLDREMTSSYTVTVFAQDGAIRHRRGTARLIITVEDDNDHTPVFTESQYSISVKEDVPIGYSITRITASDEDIGLNALVTYQILAGNYRNTFAMNDTTGEITTAAKLDRETNSTFYLLITGRDGGQPRRETNTTVVITVIDVNDNTPKFTQSMYNVTFKERTIKGTVIVVVQANDPDEGANGNIRYFIEAGNINNIFSIEPQTGVIKLIGDLDYETQARYNLTVKASDGATISPKHGFTTVLVEVTDINDNAPVFHRITYSASLLENATLGSFVIQVNATDADKDVADKKVFYRIVGGDGENAFAINELNGSVTLNASGPGLDRERKDMYRLKLVAASHVNGTDLESDPVTLTVTVLDVNDVTPTFSQVSYTKRITEDTADGINVDALFTFTAADEDLGSNSEIVYSIEAGNNEGLFKLDNKTGNLFRAKTIDREHKNSFLLVILATDQGNPPLSSNSTLNISVDDRNDNAPVFHGQANASVMENTTVGSLIATVNATDADAGTNSDITYSIISGNKNDVFELGSSTGVLKTVKQLDYETIPEYELTIQAKDKGSDPRSEIRKFKIIVININDNQPVFKERSVKLSVEENLPGNTIVGKIGASDDDQNEIYYYIISGNKNNLFSLNETTGVLKTTKAVDREESARYVLYIKSSNFKDSTTRKRRAVDTSNSSNVAPEPDNPSVQLVVIEIGDTNDNPPQFTKKEFTAGVSEDAKFGSSVLQVTALDSDSGNNSLIAYTLINGSGFNVEKDSGWITAKESYAGKSGEEYFLYILAQDNFGTAPAYNDTAKVKIYVLTDQKRVMLISGIYDVERVRANKAEFVRVLSKVTGFTVHIDDINYHKLDNGEYDKLRVDVLFHAINPLTNKIVDKDVVISKLDQNYHTEAAFFSAWKIYEVKPKIPNKQEDGVNLLLVVCIALGVLLFLVILFFCCVIWRLRKRQERMLRAATAASLGNGTAPSHQMDNLPTTNLHIAEGSNPVWVDPYHNWGMTSDDEVDTIDNYLYYDRKSQLPRVGKGTFESQLPQSFYKDLEPVSASGEPYESTAI